MKTGMPILIDNPHELGRRPARQRGRGLRAVRRRLRRRRLRHRDQLRRRLGGRASTWAARSRPGVEISLTALTERGGQDPADRARPSPRRRSASRPRAAIQSGVIFGFAGLIDGIARRMQRELGGEPTFIATGGLARAIVPFCETIDEVDDLLTLTGLRLIWERNAVTPAAAHHPVPDRRRRDRQPRPARPAGRDRQLVRAPAGAPPRRRARGLGDGLELRDPPPQRAHAARRCCASTPTSTRSRSSSSATTPR